MRKLLIGDSVAYRGYLIKKLLVGYAIEKGGFYIGFAPTVEIAKATIDLLV